MQVSEQIVHIAAVQLVPHRGHQVSSMYDRRRHAFIGCSRAAWQRRFFKYAQQRRSMQRPVLPVVVARRASRLEHPMPTRRLCVQRGQRSRWRRGVATGQSGSACKQKQCTRNLHMALFSHHVVKLFGNLLISFTKQPHSSLVIPASHPLQSSAAENLVLCIIVRQIDALSSKEKYAP